MSWIPLHVHDHYSLLDGLSKPKDIAKRCANLNYNSCAITNHGNVASVVSFMKAMKDVCKCGEQKSNHADGGKGKCRHENGCEGFQPAPIKPIIGCEFYLSKESPTLKNSTNSKHAHLCVLAKNLDGWKALVGATSLANNPDYFYKKPRLQLDHFEKFTKSRNLIAFSGHMGSELANVMFGDIDAAYSAKTYEEAKALVHPDWKQRAIALAGKYQEIFGKENFFIEIQLIDHKNLPAAEIVAKALRWVAKKIGCPCLATSDSHYCCKEDAIDQRVLLCSLLETTLNQVNKKIDSSEEFGLSTFFKSNNYHIPDLQEMTALHEPEELLNSVKIAEMCETYNIFSQPKLPTFSCPNNLDPDEYLKALCRQGWKNLIANSIPKEKQPIYVERVKKELEVFKKANLASYFLIVADYCRYAKHDLGLLMSPSRGSGGGSLVSMLVGISDKSIDPIEHDLLFERFYNDGRNAPGRVSLPDIDCDFPINSRDIMKEYIKNKYGVDKVCEMVTFSRIQGRGALKEVLRTHEACSFDEMNLISEHIPDEAKIADELQEMREEEGESSIIKWALENRVEKLKQWCWIDKDGNFEGPYSKLFEQAIRLEGTKKSQSKHAAGIIISSEPLADICPMVYDKSNNCMIAGLEMNDLEAMGHIKFDILGVAILDKMMGVSKLLRTGEIGD